jgi:hypothetical protein
MVFKNLVGPFFSTFVLLLLAVACGRRDIDILVPTEFGWEENTQRKRAHKISLNEEEYQNIIEQTVTQSFNQQQQREEAADFELSGLVLGISADIRNEWGDWGAGAALGVELHWEKTP